jgi:hypothetical protein
MSLDRLVFVALPISFKKIILGTQCVPKHQSHLSNNFWDAIETAGNIFPKPELIAAHNIFENLSQ